MEILYEFRCPHCEKQQSHTLDKGGGEVQCEACEKTLWIATSGGDIVHSHVDTLSVESFRQLLEQDPDPFSKHECPHCGREFAARNYFRNVGRVVCNHCHKVVHIIVGYNNSLRILRAEYPAHTVFDEAPETQAPGQ